MRILFSSLLLSGIFISFSASAAPSAKKECSIYKVKAFAQKKKSDVFLVLYPKSRSETKIKIGSDSSLKVFPFINQVGNYTVKLKGPYKNFALNAGEVLTAELGLPQPHLPGSGTSIICIE